MRISVNIACKYHETFRLSVNRNTQCLYTYARYQHESIMYKNSMENIKYEVTNFEKTMTYELGMSV